MRAEETTLEDVKLIQLPKVMNPAGSITAINDSIDIPFDLSRVYYLYDIPGGQDRGGHAHRELQQLIVAASGSFSILLKDGRASKEFNLKRPYEGLLLPPGLWRELRDFSSGSICLVLASHAYSESDYIREFSDFLSFKGLSS
jgi:hypothetical protein